MFFYYVAIAALSFLVTFILTHFLIPRLKRFGITGKDENKEGHPEVPEMGGIAIIAGFTAGVLLALFFSTFADSGFRFNIIHVLAALITIHSISFIGIVDDLLSIPQWLKAVLPLFAAIPLVVVSAAGSTSLTIPFAGTVDFGLLYLFILVPIGIAVCSNLTNMLAGFNGMEAGMGAVIFGTMSTLAISTASIEMAVVFLPMLFALLAFLYYNRFPARIFPGDVGNLTIGVALAAGVVIGNLETAGAILMVPYVIDFFIKVSNRFPHTYQEIREGKLYPREGRVAGFVHVVMRAFNGISESSLSVFFVALEAVFGIIVLLLYFPF